MVASIINPHFFFSLSAKFDGLYSNSDLLVQWTTCCTTDPNA